MRRFSLPGILIAAVIIAAFPSFAAADALGQTETFRANTDYDADSAEYFTATLQVISEHAYFYVDHRHWDTLSPAQQGSYRVILESLGRTFDQAVYPRLTGFWGSEHTPGVDGDPRITIAIQRMKSGLGGYFMSLNGYSASIVQGYNVREMLYVSADGIANSRGDDFLAHEFQHLISQNQKEFGVRREEDRWLNEARSEYSPTVAGFSEPFQGSNLQRRVQTFLREPGDSLVQWDAAAADYAAVTLFIHYLADRYGSDIVRSTISAPEVGIDAINVWLAGKGRTERFPEVFADWAIASLINDRSSDIRYGYARDGLDQFHITSDATAVITDSTILTNTHTLQEWEPVWSTFVPAGAPSRPYLEARLSGQSGNWYCAAVARYGGTTNVHYCPGSRTLSIPTVFNGTALSEATVISFHGFDRALGDGDATSATSTLTVSFTDEATEITLPVMPSSGALQDGDLIRHGNEPEVYVLWGTYRRYLPQGVLELYGFQDRPVYSVDNATFNRYTTSNYARVVGTEPVYALWPDGTKHWLNITPATWDASGRDWNAIFIINEAEGVFYETGSDITR
jgi:hypothetical protein